MTNEEQHAHDVETAKYRSQRQGMTESQLVDQALATLMLFVYGGDKYKIPPADCATYDELMHRAQPSAGF